MRPRVAYISSLGTTAILVGAALFLLGVVSAIVAFHGWPGSDRGANVQSVPLTGGAARVRVADVVRAAPVRRVVRSRPASARIAAARASTTGLVKVVATGPTVVPGLAMVPTWIERPPSAQAPAPTRPNHPGSGGGGSAGPPSVPSDPVNLLPDAGSLPPLPGPSGAPPSTEQLQVMVGHLLPPPPPVLRIR